MTNRIIKCKCKKTDKIFILELKDIDGEWKIINMVDINNKDAEHLSTELKLPTIYTANNLLPCFKCKSRKFASCSCAKDKKKCKFKDPYNFQCVYCNELEIDYSSYKIASPYTKWAGISNIPDAIKDRFGNPQGNQYDLAMDNAFNGYVIFVFIFKCSEFNFNGPKKALEKKGFKIFEYRSMPDINTLTNLLKTPRSQVWIISGYEQYITNEQCNLFIDYFNRGNGLYIWSDNDPYFADTNIILKTLFNAEMQGNYYGDKVISIKKNISSPGIIPNHHITTGIVNFYEGITISNIISNNVDLKPLVYSSDLKIVTAYYDMNYKRALIDGGFTRLYHKWDSAGTDRYVVNAAVWLTNIERFGYQNDNKKYSK